MEVLMKTFEAQVGPGALHTILNKQAEQPEWAKSSLNPKNRIERASSLDSSGWEITGADVSEQRLYILPKFAFRRAPVRIDVYLGSGIDIDDPLCKPLHGGLASLFQATAAALRKQPLILHILHALQHWSRSTPKFQDEYMKMPFGSWILVENIACSVSDMRIHLIANHELERQWLSPKALQQMWCIPDEKWPETVEFSQLRVLTQPHDAVTIVTCPERWGHRQLLFKSTTKKTRYLYHELKLLLKIDPHPNIIPGPVNIVTKTCNFGGKRGVCGFLLEFYPTGNLAQYLQPAGGDTVHCTLADQLRWAVQLGSALLHVKTSRAGYYSDFKLDNIVLKPADQGYDVVLIDFEQRGAWFSWSPPELNHFTVLESYIFSVRRLRLDESATAKSTNILQSCLPGWRKKSLTGRYCDDASAHNPAWSDLTPEEQEKATVFMFGKVLWCLFECQPSMTSTFFYGANIFKDTGCEPRFPRFDKTPPLMQQLIKDCTAGAPEWMGEQRCVTASGSTLFPSNPAIKATLEQTRQVMIQWWEQKIQEAEIYVEARASGRMKPGMRESLQQRPSLQEVIIALKRFSETEGLL